MFIYGRKVDNAEAFYLVRIPVHKLENKKNWLFFSGFNEKNDPIWSDDMAAMKPIFTDSNTTEFQLNSFCVQYFKGLNRFIAVTSHGGAGQIGVFDSANPWGPWSTVAYYENWLGMSGGIFLSMSFPGKWISHDSIDFWAVFSVHGPPKPKTYHDKLNIIKGRFKMRSNS
jgi:hypothetical protein